MFAGYDRIHFIRFTKWYHVFTQFQYYYVKLPFRYNKKKKRLELPFTATEEMPEYSNSAKGVLFFNGKSWSAACDQKVCEVLP